MEIRLNQGFHYGAGENILNGWTQWWESLHSAGLSVNAIGADNAGPIWEIQQSNFPGDMLVWRRSLWHEDFDPNSPNYTANPEEEALRMLSYKYDILWPRKADGSDDLDRHKTWLKDTNEIRTQTNPGDVWWENLAPGEWWGRYAKAGALWTVQRGYKVIFLSPSSGDHDAEFWDHPAMLDFLTYAAIHRDNVIVGLHEYAYVAHNLFALVGNDDATVDELLASPLWQRKVGRFKILFDVCDNNGIDWPTLYFCEWGWALNDVPNEETAMQQIYTATEQVYGPYYRYIRGFGCWYLGVSDRFGRKIAEKTNALLEPSASVAINQPVEVEEKFPSGEPVDPPPIDPPPTESTLFAINFTGWGEKDNQEPVGWKDSAECPHVQIPYAIAENGRFPMRYQGWTGDNPYNPDGQEWNDFACPEAVVMWDALLPPDEHYYLNEFGRTQHWFTPQKAGRSRFYTSIYLQPGNYRLNLDFYGDFSKMVDGQKVPQADPQHGQVELFIGVMAQDEMIDINLLGANSISREFLVTVAGDYVVGYGILSRYAAGSDGTAGAFLQGFVVTAVEEEVPPVGPPDGCGQTPTIKRTVHLLPQDITLAEEQEIVANFHADKNSFVYSHDDAIVIQLAGDPERSIVYVWEPERRNPADLEIMEACGVRWEARYFEETEPPEPGEFRFTHWPTPHRYVTQEFLANPSYYQQFNLPGHDGVDVRAYHGDPIYTVASGTISQVNHDPNASNYGIYVRVAHADGYETTYAHLIEAVRTTGEAVTGGDIVGLADNTGNSTGTHLHMTLKQKEVVFVDRCGNTWPYNICDPTPFMVGFDGVTWPGGSPGFPCPGEPPPTGEEINLRHYQVGVPTAFRVVKHVDGNGHETNEDVQDMWIDNNTVVMRKNVNGEWYRFEGGYRKRLLDTSPGPDSRGTARVYRMTQDGMAGGRVNPDSVNAGNRWTDSTSHHVQFYAKDGCRELPENSGNVVSWCEARIERNVTFNTYGQNLTFDEVVYVMTNNGEEQMYGVYQGQVVGWIGWLATWGRTEPVEIHFNRGVLTQEPNRYCSW